jgi:carbamoyltransferase
LPSVQDLLEETALYVARALQRRTGARDLCLAGGVALNSVMNTRLLREAGFERIFVQPAASDAGNALGAALWVWHQQLGRSCGDAMTHAYFGTAWPEGDLASALAGQGLRVRPVADPADEAARLLADGRIIGWFQGRAEVGPRALGARSILADPRRAETKDIVNARVKRREAFRPFAPSVLDEHGGDFFEGHHSNPFMLLSAAGAGRMSGADPGGHPRGRHGATAVGRGLREPALSPADQPVRRPHRRSGRAQHQLQPPR